MKLTIVKNEREKEIKRNKGNDTSISNNNELIVHTVYAAVYQIKRNLNIILFKVRC